MNILIAGGTGFIGRALTAHLIHGGHTVTILTRFPPSETKTRCTYLAWNGTCAETLIGAITTADALINLAGERVGGKRWSEKQKAEIRESRRRITSALIDGVAKAPTKPSVFINASAVGYYGPHGDEILDETSSAGTDFLATVCRETEEAATRITATGVRLAIVRIGIVLGKEGGMLQKMLPIYKSGLGGIPGSGRPWLSWIHLDDLARAFDYLVTHPHTHGVYNATAPNPVRMREFIHTLGHILHRPTFWPTPAWLLSLLYGEQATLFLTGQRVKAKRLHDEGFVYQYPTLHDALRSIIE